MAKLSVGWPSFGEAEVIVGGAAVVEVSPLTAREKGWGSLPPERSLVRDLHGIGPGGRGPR